MNEILIHYSRNPLATNDMKTMEQSLDFRSDKPKGLWVSVQGEHDWREWCAAESYGIGPLAHHVTLEADARILRLCSSTDLDDFTREHEVHHRSYDAIDWPRIANRYSGIIIAPYIWERRLDGRASHWYYSWDCASGCIWDSSAVKEIRRVPELDPVTSEREVMA